MGKGAAAGRFAPGGSQHGSSRLGTSRRTPRAGLVPDKRAPALKREQNSSYLLQSAIAQSVRAPAASAPVLLRPGLGTSIQKEQLQKKAAGTRAAPRGVTASSPLSPAGMGAEARVHPRVLPQGTRRAILGTCSDAGGAGEVSPMRSPCSSWFWGVWVGFFFFLDAGSCDAPPPAASSQTHRDHAGLLKYHLLQWSLPGSEPKPKGPGVVSGGWVLVVVFFFVVFFALNFL